MEGLDELVEKILEQARLNYGKIPVSIVLENLEQDVKDALSARMYDEGWDSSWNGEELVLE